ncbi:MAG: hypothetical protein K1X78_00285 [Verrucomicrobiaceae bacterium]|nr:hypothetical protein [Verrucomicrobiaceae bacterium]
MPPAGAKRSHWGYPSTIEHDGLLRIVYTAATNGLRGCDMTSVPVMSFSNP